MSASSRTRPVTEVGKSSGEWSTCRAIVTCCVLVIVIAFALTLAAFWYGTGVAGEAINDAEQVAILTKLGLLPTLKRMAAALNDAKIYFSVLTIILIVTIALALIAGLLLCSGQKA